MVERVDGAVLWLRALLVASIAFFLGTAGHVTSDGRLPGPAVLPLVFGASVLLAVPMLARPASPTRLVALVVAGQTLLHLALTMSAGHVGDPVATAGPARRTALDVLPTVEGQRQGSLLDAYSSMSSGQHAATPTLPVGHLVADLRSHATMMAAHVVVAVVVGLWLAYGERCLFTLLALTGRRLVLALDLLVARPVLRRPRLRPVPVHRLPIRPADWLARPGTRRGPPLLSV